MSNTIHVGEDVKEFLMRGTDWRKRISSENLKTISPVINKQMTEQKLRQLHIVLWNDSKMITAYTINGNIWSTVFRCSEEQLGSKLVIEKLTEGYNNILIHTEKEWFEMIGSKEEEK